MPVLFNLNLGNEYGKLESNFITSEGAESIGKLLPRVLILILSSYDPIQRTTLSIATEHSG